MTAVIEKLCVAVLILATDSEVAFVVLGVRLEIESQGMYEKEEGGSRPRDSRQPNLGEVVDGEQRGRIQRK